MLVSRISCSQLIIDKLLLWPDYIYFGAYGNIKYQVKLIWYSDKTPLTKQVEESLVEEIVFGIL